jgi:hypothetical protein
MIRLTLLTLPISGSQYSRSHWAIKRDLRLKYAWELLAALSETPWELRPKDETPRQQARVTVFWGKGQRMFDDDNLAAGLKPLIDGMRDIGLIRNDSPRWFRLEARQDRDPERPRVEIEMEAVAVHKRKNKQEKLQ